MSARGGASDRVQRLLSIVSWIASHDGPTLDEVCNRFDLGRRELLADLELAQMVGADSPEYSDMPIEVDLEGDRVFVFLHALRRPLRLTPEQGLALVAAGEGLRNVPGHDPEGPLARALAKVAGVLGVDPGDAVQIDLGEADPDALSELRRAAAEHLVVSLDHYSAGRDVRRRRTVEPWRIFSEAGAWYLEGFCRDVGEGRVFRVDRIRHLEVLEERFEPPTDLPPPRALRVGAEDPRVVLEVDEEARWVAESYPIDEVEDLGTGWWRVTLPAAAPAWLERLLLRLGPHGRLVHVDPRVGRPDMAAQAAARLLARYRRGAAGAGGTSR